MKNIPAEKNGLLRTILIASGVMGAAYLSALWILMGS